MLLLDSKYPILCAPMNKVSDLNLALACHSAGVFPSLSFYNYCFNDIEYDLEKFENDLKKFLDKTGSSTCLISMGFDHFTNESILQVLIDNNFKKIELIEGVYKNNIPEINNIKMQNNLELFVKILEKQFLPEADALILKGPEGAGRSKGVISLEEMFTKAKNLLPNNIAIIPSGGISTSEQIKDFLDRGAAAVAIGSLFAATIESPISKESKLKLVQNTSHNLMRFNELNSQALIFSKVDDDDSNHTKSLIKGITNPNIGHIFVGKSIDKINRIKSVRELVDELIVCL